MDNWVLISVTTICHVTSTTIMTQNVSKKKKKWYRTSPPSQKVPSCPMQSHPSSQPQATSDRLSVATPYFVISRILQKWNCTAYVCVSALSPQCHIGRFIVLLYYWLFVLFYCCEIWTHPGLSLYLLMNIWVIYSLGLLWAALLWRFVCKRVWTYAFISLG